MDRQGTGAAGSRTARRRFWIWTGLVVAFVGSLLVLYAARERSLRDVERVVRAAALRHGVDPALAMGVVYAESRGNPRAESPKQAYGLMQLLVPTASEMAGRPVTVDELFDPERNAHLGCLYLRRLLERYDGEVRTALMAYNAGMGNVARWRRAAGTDDPDRLLATEAYPVTRAYVATVLEARERYRHAPDP